MKGVIQWAIVIFLLWWIVTQPHSAALFTRHLAAWLDTMAKGLSAFAQNV